MSGPSIYNIEPTSLTLGAVLARGAYGTVLYQADLQQGGRSIQVCLVGNRFQAQQCIWLLFVLL